MAEDLKARMLAALDCVFAVERRERREMREAAHRDLKTQDKALTNPPGAVSQNLNADVRRAGGGCENKIKKNQILEDVLTDLTLSQDWKALRRKLGEEAFHDLEERAAILEYEAGLPCTEAESRALEELREAGRIPDPHRGRA